MNDKEIKILENVVKNKWIKFPSFCSLNISSNDPVFNVPIIIEKDGIYFIYYSYLVNPKTCLYADTYNSENWMSFEELMKEEKEKLNMNGNNVTYANDDELIEDFVIHFWPDIITERYKTKYRVFSKKYKETLFTFNVMDATIQFFFTDVVYNYFKNKYEKLNLEQIKELVNKIAIQKFKLYNTKITYLYQPSEKSIDSDKYYVLESIDGLNHKAYYNCINMQWDYGLEYATKFTSEKIAIDELTKAKDKRILGDIFYFENAKVVEKPCQNHSNMIEIKKGTTFYLITTEEPEENTIVDIIFDTKNSKEVIIFRNLQNTYLAIEKSIFIQANEFGIYKTKLKY